MTYYIIRKGIHENHSNNISSITWLDWEIEDEEEVVRAHFNELVEKENITKNNTKYNVKKGTRNDVDEDVMSSWEANIIRLFKYLNIEYKYESDSYKLNGGYRDGKDDYAWLQWCHGTGDYKTCIRRQ